MGWVLGQFAPQKAIARHRYIEFVHEGCLNPSSPWEQLRAQVVYGSEAFLDGLGSHLKGQSLAEEVPKVQRHAARPQLTELFTGAGREGKAQRDADIVKAHLEFGYTQKQIARHIGLHYSTVSKIVSANSE
ncbi:helix-turn-helix domain-containing protein [Desulfosediminicola sp.]|uniref:helix-turn-helix domain-containing protein n=1 Tax=Desulfosediminicola sp. TaxID=2886825 RepID=UPI003AF1E6E5